MKERKYVVVYISAWYINHDIHFDNTIIYNVISKTSNQRSFEDEMLHCSKFWKIRCSSTFNRQTLTVKSLPLSKKKTKKNKVSSVNLVNINECDDLF